MWFNFWVRFSRVLSKTIYTAKMTRNCKIRKKKNITDEYTGCPIENDSTLKSYRFRNFWYFFKRFSLFENFILLFYACGVARVDMQSLLLSIVSKLSQEIRKYHLSFYENCILWVIGVLLSASVFFGENTQSNDHRNVLKMQILPQEHYLWC